MGSVSSPGIGRHTWLPPNNSSKTPRWIARGAKNLLSAAGIAFNPDRMPSLSSFPGRAEIGWSDRGPFAEVAGCWSASATWVGQGLYRGRCPVGARSRCDPAHSLRRAYRDLWPKSGPKSAILAISASWRGAGQGTPVILKARAWQKTAARSSRGRRECQVLLPRLNKACPNLRSN